MVILLRYPCAYWLRRTTDQWISTWARRVKWTTWWIYMKETYTKHMNNSYPNAPPLRCTSISRIEWTQSSPARWVLEALLNEQPVKKYLPELNESLVEQQRNKISGQVVAFARQQQDPIKSFRPELDVNLCGAGERATTGNGKLVRMGFEQERIQVLYL